jgi:acetylornithine deacetylase/succinyl-diaminopimelate desuccinylase-like protein
LDAGLDEHRLTDIALSLVEIPSYPGDEERIASKYGEMLREAGARVELDRAVAGSPSVVGRAGRGRRRLQLAGHLDTVPIPHDAPEIVDGVLYGRGACDMKAGLAAITETARVLAPALDDLDAELLVTAYGLHEGAGAAPMHTPLRGLLARGCHGDAAIVAEGPRASVPVAGKGSLIFRFEIVRSEAGPDHELRAEATANPIMAAHRLITLLDRRVAASPLEHAALGRETFFVGSIHGGDLYNRVPVRVGLEGTRRYPPPRRWNDVVAELDELCGAVEDEFGVRVERSYERSGQPFELPPDTPIVRAVREAHREVVGTPLLAGHQLFASDLNHFVDAGVPAAAYGVDPDRGHSTPEYVSLSELFLTARVFLRAAVRFFRMSLE